MNAAADAFEFLKQCEGNLPRRQFDLLEGAYHYDAIVTNMNWETERQIQWHNDL